MRKVKEKTFLICPVRGHSKNETAHLVKDLEKHYKVHWPPRDTDQVDDTGYRICRDNEAAIDEADVIHVVWDGKSQGCLFDLGMCFAKKKRMIPVELPKSTNGKSFQNMLKYWAAIERY